MMRPPASRPVPPLVVVLGASGYLGSVVAALLSSRPIRLRSVARRPCRPAPGARAEIDEMSADLTDREQLAAAVAGADVVLHLVKQSGDWREATQDHAANEPVNVGVMRALVETLAGRPGGGPPPLVVFAASCTQVGRPPTGPMNGTEADRPQTHHERQKLAAEHVLKIATAEGTIRGVSLRLSTVFGQSPLSGEPDIGVVTTMVRRALADEPLTIWHDGTIARDLTYVEDAAAAFLAAFDRPDHLVGRHWLVGTGRAEGLGSVFRMVATAVAAQTGRATVPVESVPPPAEAQVTDFLSYVVDSTAFRSATGWSPRLSLREGLDRTVSALLKERA